ncbi:MAG: ABC transporter permease subunit [Pseudomonadota bacterium]
MTTVTDGHDTAPFRLGQLLYDTRYRSLTIQVIAFILLMLGFSWLAYNTVQNLAALGKDFDFGFLGARAGYDISQRLVEYSNDSSHARAAFVGILNTLLVAVLGCITATVIGVIAGVLRLSNNWLVARLMSIYVEGFRNVPLLLWILVIFAVFSESLPHPSTFRADAETGEAESSMIFGLIALTRQGTFIPRLVYADGGWIFVAALVVAGGIVWGLRRAAKRRQEATGQVTPLLLPSLGIFIVALLGAYFIISAQSRSSEMALIGYGAEDGMTLADYAEAQGRIDYCRIRGSGGSFSAQTHLETNDIAHRVREYFGPDDAGRDLAAGRCALYAVPSAEAASVIEELTPSLRGDATLAVLGETVNEGAAVQMDVPGISESGIPRMEGGLPIRNSLIALWFALSLYTGAFVAEIVRAGILAINKGQTEASYALGLRPSRTMNLVILPQALRVIIPPLISQYLNLTKNSSLAIAVGYMDVRSTLGGITINQTGRELEGILLLGLFYLLTSLIIAAVMNVYNNAVKLRER